MEMKGRKDELSKILRRSDIRLVQITWEVPSDWGKANNGGDYAFYSTYWRTGDGRWKEEEWTSSEFEYCPKGQGFQRCISCAYWQWGDEDGEGHCTLPWNVVSSEELADIVKDHPFAVRSSWKDPNCMIVAVDATVKEA